MSNNWYNPNYDPASDLMFAKPPAVIANKKDIDLDPSFTNPTFQQAGSKIDPNRAAVDYNEQLVLLRDVASSTQNYSHLTPHQQYLLQEKMLQDQLSRQAQMTNTQAASTQTYATSAAQQHAAALRQYEIDMARYQKEKAAYDAYMMQLQQQNQMAAQQQFAQQQQRDYQLQMMQQQARDQRMSDPAYRQQVYYQQQAQQHRR